MVPTDLHYTKEHEWAKIQGDTVTVGITDYAQQSLGEITFVELPPLNKQVPFNDALAVVESSKAASDVYAPLAGTVVEVNMALESQPELINQDCYGQGWICRLRLDNPGRTDELLSPAEYEEYLKSL